MIYKMTNSNSGAKQSGLLALEVVVAEVGKGAAESDDGVQPNAGGGLVGLAVGVGGSCGGGLGGRVSRLVARYMSAKK